jgi:heme/copper-type cytochrome/quinol oxidase subunit 2
MAADDSEGLAEAVDRYIPKGRRIMLHLGIIVLVSIVAWLAFFWFAPVAMVIPEEGARELAPSQIRQVRLFLGIMTGMPTVILGVLSYCLWLFWQGRKARRKVLEAAGRRARR